MTTEVTYTLEDVVDAINYVGESVNEHDPKNDFGMTVGDELHNIEFQLSRIADALEKIANK